MIGELTPIGYALIAFVVGIAGAVLVAQWRRGDLTSRDLDLLEFEREMRLPRRAARPLVHRQADDIVARAWRSPRRTRP